MPSKSGIAETPTGERHIPQSTRPDGSLRKEIRVRPGYRPPEDVEVYKNKVADSWKNRGKGGVPGVEFVDAPKPKKPVKAKPVKELPEPSKLATKEESQTEACRDGGEQNSSAKLEDPEAEKQKEARKLHKKLRQARDLQQRKDKGDALLPEQFEKVIKMNELIRQLNRLGFDEEGQEKP